MIKTFLWQTTKVVWKINPLKCCKDSEQFVDIFSVIVLFAIIFFLKRNNLIICFSRVERRHSNVSFSLEIEQAS